MKSKIISLGIISLVCSFASLAHAEDYYSNQTPNGGGYYSTSSTHTSDTYYSKQIHRNPNRHRLVRWEAMFPGSLMPRNAVIGGYENGTPLYVCHTNYNGGTHPGKVVGGNCNIGFGGREIVTSQYEILVSNEPLNWVPGSNGYLPPNAIQGGIEDNGTPLYICQTHFHGSMHPGKIVGQKCNISWGGAEISKFNYNVLVR